MQLNAIRNSLRYDKASGKLYWKQMLSKNVLPGREAGTVHRKGHIVIQVHGQRYMAHRIAWLLHYGVVPNGVIDHINGNGCDNRIENLRDVTMRTNQQNRRTPQSNSKSGLIGASFHRRTGKWVAQIKTPAGRKHLGLFITAELAHQAYLSAKRKLHEGCTI